MIRSLLLAALALGGGLFATGAAADWLVAKDGSRIETQGPWEVKGRLVVFTTAQGELASMRADDLDLGESRALTEAGPAPATAPPAPPARAERSAALVITDADVEHIEPELEEVEGEASEEAVAKDLVVSTWQQNTGPEGGVTIRGTVRNNGNAVATGVRVLVDVQDREGQSLGTQDAILTSSTLGIGDSLSFRAAFSDVQIIDTAKFTVTSTNFATAKSAAKKAPAGQALAAASTDEASGAADAPPEDAAPPEDEPPPDEGDLEPEDDADFSETGGLDVGG